MPELPEVETVRRSLAPLVVGRTIEDVVVRCRKLRRPVPRDLAARLVGQTICAAHRRGKYLLFDLGGGRSWIFHFGMSGRLLHVDGSRAVEPGKHDHVIARLEGKAKRKGARKGATEGVGAGRGAGALVFNDPRRFGLTLVDDPASCPLLTELGPEPFDQAGFNADRLAELRRRTNRTVKDVLMDQHVVAGLGNIYVNEILFQAGVRPRRRMTRVKLPECERIVDATRAVLREAIEHRGSTVADFLDGIGRKGGYQWRHQVYDRAGQPCQTCGATIKAVVVAQRSSFYCPHCQV